MNGAGRASTPQREAALPVGVARDRVLATRRVLVLAVLLIAAAWALAAGLTVLAALAAADAVLEMPRSLRELVRPGSGALAVGAALLVAWRGRGVLSPVRVALWVEEQVPWLRYALVTAAEPAHSRRTPMLEADVAEAAWGGVLLRRVARALVRPLVVSVAAAVILIALPRGAVARVADPAEGDALEHVPFRRGSDASRLAPLIAVVEPPAYTGLPRRTLEEPSMIGAVVGSRITLRGRGGPDGVAARLGEGSVPARANGGRWEIAIAMPARPAAVRLSDGLGERLVALEPVSDSAPTVVLTRPARDSVLRDPTGRIALEARARDDFGLSALAFEYIVTSGEGEVFEFRTGRFGAQAPGGARELTGRAEVALDTLALKPGDIVHLRAVGRDINSVTGAQEGTSETRTLRIARLGEYDTVAVEAAAPPEADQSAISQRMLIMLAEALEARRPGLQRDVVLRESRAIARDQSRLRLRVGEIIFMRLAGEDAGEHAHGPGDGHDHSEEELARFFQPDSLLAAASRATGLGPGDATDHAHGESPVVAINRPLLEAYNHMWEAARSLEQGEPGRALPAMRRALDALQEARQAERYYLRGRPPTIIVDVAAVRLQRQERVSPAERRGRPIADAERTTRAARFAAALDLLTGAPAAAVDSLLLLRLDALEEAPALAIAIGEAIDAMRTGRDATQPLRRARRALEGEPRSRAGLPEWSGWW